jgi:hypothetical protein
MNQIDCSGFYNCEFCREPFVEKRYNIDEKMYFCLPECMVSYHWNVLGHSKYGENAKKRYEGLFGRYVVPAPEQVYNNPNFKEPRSKWLFEYCRNEKYLPKKQDQQKASEELLLGGFRQVRKK